MVNNDEFTLRACVRNNTNTPCTGFSTDLTFVPPVGPRDPKIINCKLLNVVLKRHDIYDVTFKRVGDIDSLR